MAINKVGSKGIEDGAIAAVDFADETVSSDKFANTTIENAKLSNSSITAAGSSISLGGSVSFNNQFVDWQSVVTSDGSTVTTMESGKGYFIDTTSGAQTVNIPSLDDSTLGDTIMLKDFARTWDSNAVTICLTNHCVPLVALPGIAFCSNDTTGILKHQATMAKGIQIPPPIVIKTFGFFL